MKSIPIITLLLAATPFTAQAKDKAEQRLKNAPAAVQATTKEHSRGGVLDDFKIISIESKTIYIAEFDLPADLKVYVADGGALVKTREEITVKQTPAAVLEAVRGLGGTIDDVEKEVAGKAESYHLEIDREGEEDLEVIVAADGTILSQKAD